MHPLAGGCDCPPFELTRDPQHTSRIFRLVSRRPRDRVLTDAVRRAGATTLWVMNADGTVPGRSPTGPVSGVASGWKERAGDSRRQDLSDRLATGSAAPVQGGDGDLFAMDQSGRWIALQTDRESDGPSRRSGRGRQKPASSWPFFRSGRTSVLLAVGQLAHSSESQEHLCIPGRARLEERAPQQVTDFSGVDLLLEDPRISAMCRKLFSRGVGGIETSWSSILRRTTREGRHLREKRHDACRGSLWAYESCRHGARAEGEVYKARTAAERTWRSRCCRLHLSASPEVRQAFEREAKTISQLSHPHICALYDVGLEGENEYLVMEYLEGETLLDRLARGPLSLEQTLRYGQEIADALDKAHRHGIVLGPEAGQHDAGQVGVKLLDFGLARRWLPPDCVQPDFAADTSWSDAGRDNPRDVPVHGARAPRRQEADGRTDIFAFGAVLYEMATGKKHSTAPSQHP